MENSFGEIIKAARTQKGWTVEEFISFLKSPRPSKAYICKIEKHGEIPSDSLICRMAIALNLNMRSLLNVALVLKVNDYFNAVSNDYNRTARHYELELLSEINPNSFSLPK